MALRNRSRIIVVGVACLLALLAFPGPTFAATCPAANPNDASPDATALQLCLDAGGTILLSPGSPGYLLDHGLVVKLSGTTLQTTVPNALATIKAMPGLGEYLLTLPRFSPINNLTITGIRFDGDRTHRTVLSLCDGVNGPGNVAILSGSGHVFQYSESSNALCATALNVAGSNMLITGNLFANNGTNPYPADPPAGIRPWADGITLSFCPDSTVSGNTVIDATDVAIVSFQGTSCRIVNNIVRQPTQHAFAGIQLGVPVDGFTASHKNGEVSANTVDGLNNLSWGIYYGAYAWFPNSTATHGTIQGNTVSGASINLMVDGTKFGTMGQNTVGDTAPTSRCGAPAKYVVNLNHITGTVLWPGFVHRDMGRCFP